MKKNLIVICIFTILAIVFGSLLIPNKNAAAEGYLRVHIRANSNSDEDQNIKYVIKEYITDYLTPLVTDCKTASEAMKVVKDNLSSLSSLASLVLAEHGFNYKANAVLKEEWFPTRSYDSEVLENGFYDALIINLGTGNGDNWWCVVYPPLCFIGAENLSGQVKYKSIISKLLGNKN